MASDAPPVHRLAHYPSWLTRWLGYRPTTPKKHPPFIICFWSFVGAFSGLAVIQAVFGQAHYFIDRGVPIIIASYGASAVLVYGAVDAPLSQPRSLIGGHFIGALVGVSITKLVALVPTEQRYLQLEWLAGSLATATAIVAMQLTQTVHPPAGATALLAAVNDDIRDLGWYYLPVILLSSTLMLAVALFLNNIQRHHPEFWISPNPPRQPPILPTAGARTEPVAGGEGASASRFLGASDGGTALANDTDGREVEKEAVAA